MLRVLFVIPIGEGIPVFGYGLMLMLAFLAGIGLACYRAKSRGISRDAVIDIGLYSLISGVVGARIAYLLLDHVPSPEDNWKTIFAVWQGGLTFQGGLLLAVLVSWLYLRVKKISVARMTDAYAPALALGVGIGRIGCFLNGCCWGRPSPADHACGVIFPADSDIVQRQISMVEFWPKQWDDFVQSLGYTSGTLPPVAVYPTQIYSALMLFAIAAILLLVERMWKNRQDGQIMILFVFFYSIKRFFIEFLRDDTPLRLAFGSFPGLRLGQWLSLVMFLLAIIFQIILYKKSTEKKNVRGQGNA